MTQPSAQDNAGAAPVHSPRPGPPRPWRWLALAALVIVALLLWRWAAHRAPPPAPPRPSVAVVSTVVTAADLPRYATGIGTVQATTSVTVRARVDGQIEGVGLVNIGGVQKLAIRIQLDPDKVAALGLDLETVRGALASATVNAPKGSFDGPRQSVTVYDNGQLLDPVHWNDVIVAYRSGAPIRVRDLGQAVAGPENARFAGSAFRGAAMPQSESLKSGRSVFLAVTKQPGANVIATAERDHGLSPQESIYQACLLRFRPIMMTTMCALLAALPLMLGKGAGSELRRPLGYAMVGGLLLSQALTLFTTPVIYLYLDRASLWFRERKARRAAGQAGSQD